MACRHLRGIRDETLPHVLQHCPGNTRAIDDRDDRVLAMIKKAAEPTVAKPGSQLTACFDACVEGRPGRALPQKTGDATAGNMRVRHDEKVAKYARVREFLEMLGRLAHVPALVYGGLGAVFPSNYKVLTEHLHLTKRTANQLSRRISTTYIQIIFRIGAGTAAGLL
ncbi:hypothetical protein PC118_g5204 [Phytophthora cactorum]|uniref:Uncharacterized protein n=1 Tax=Phytophthora cactorum TaxID=29920 RepID=A0A329SWZ3_9STRA|nr:hypothetical protein PC111_g5270 [Phytophthora cactorum]KAG2861999.1 hypothetical protein PC113_g6681 [Phytophthora cactorum]KAG2932724.1 hypothetical protein PC115_g5698 [Phytophthora cactorum]KAG2947810.1 hypothetical protein PC117_g6507 [Phytophthora cactorum]KAG2991208.1 hypothetical protein PC118_g5204 [Phytophthora cactorum]